MQDLRRHKRYKVDALGIYGKMTLADKVEIQDISLGGISLKADRRLNMGREYVFKIGSGASSVDIKAQVVRSELVGIESRPDGEMVSVYAAGMKFANESIPKVEQFIQALGRTREQAKQAASDKGNDISCFVAPHGDDEAEAPFHFKVVKIGMGGMAIEADGSQPLKRVMPMSLPLRGGKLLHVSGRIASCTEKSQGGKIAYEIGVEFLNLSPDDSSALRDYIDSLTVLSTVGSH